MSRALSDDDLADEFAIRWDRTRELTGQGDLKACMRFIRDTIRLGRTKAYVRADIEDRRRANGLTPIPPVAPRKPRAVSGRICDLVAAVAFTYDVPLAEILGQGRSRSVTPIRHKAMWLAHAHGFSYPDIGAVMLRHHTSVLGGARVVEARIAKRPALRKDLLAIGARSGGARQIEKRAA